MRTTLNLDPDVLDVAKRLAAAHSRTLGETISELVRRGLESPPKIKRAQGIPVFDVPRDARPFSLEDIKREDDEW